jgi:RNA polymerase sigma-70 factor (ECF subfamily)
MDPAAKGPSLVPEDFREYLGLLGQVQLGPRLRGKLDLSGVVQQTLLEAYQGWEQARPWSEPQKAAWLRRLFANNLTDAIRKLGTAGRDVSREQSLEAALDQSSCRLGALLAADQSSPSQQVERSEQTVQLANALAQLPEAQREALVLQHWHGWSLAQIGKHLGRTPAAVAGLLHRGLKQLRQHLKEP